MRKGHTEYVPDQRLNTIKQQLAKHKRFKELTQEWMTLAIELCKIKTDQDKQG